MLSDRRKPGVARMILGDLAPGAHHIPIGAIGDLEVACALRTASLLARLDAALDKVHAFIEVPLDGGLERPDVIAQPTGIDLGDDLVDDTTDLVIRRCVHGKELQGDRTVHGYSPSKLRLGCRP